MIQQGDLLLVPFPFSDQSGRKTRPVIVLSNNQFNLNSEDVIVVGVTSNLSKDKHTATLENTDLENGRLFSKCLIKVENILRLDRNLVMKKIGKIRKAKIKEIISILNDILKS